MESDVVVKRSFDLLAKILAETSASKEDENLQTFFIYRHAKNIFQLGEDATHLLKSGRSYSCPITVRVMLESLFKLVSATKAPDIAVQIIISELKDDCDKIAKYPQWLNPEVYGPISDDHSKQIQLLRDEYGITSNKTWNTLACAEAAQLDAQYRDLYFHLSSHAHVKIIGMAIQENEACVGYCLQALIFCVLTAAAYMLPIVQSDLRFDFANECEQLGEEWMRLMDEGVFRKMDEN